MAQLLGSRKAMTILCHADTCAFKHFIICWYRGVFAKLCPLCHLSGNQELDFQTLCLHQNRAALRFQTCLLPCSQSAMLVACRIRINKGFHLKSTLNWFHDPNSDTKLGRLQLLFQSSFGPIVIGSRIHKICNPSASTCRKRLKSE